MLVPCFVCVYQVPNPLQRVDHRLEFQLYRASVRYFYGVLGVLLDFLSPSVWNLELPALEVIYPTRSLFNHK